MIKELIYKYLVNKKNQKQQELIKLRWQQSQLQTAIDRAKRRRCQS